jgi:hypothetical protein
MNRTNIYFFNFYRLFIALAVTAMEFEAANAEAKSRE